MSDGEHTTILKIRTFADDLKRAGGEQESLAPQGTLTELAPVSVPQSVAPQPVIQINSAPPEPRQNVATPITATPAFDINHEIQQDVGEGTILNERPVRKNSLLSEIKDSFLTWMHQGNSPSEATTQDSTEGRTNLSVIAPRTSEQVHVQENRSPERTQQAWQRISEPRANPTLPHTSTEELAAYTTTLRAIIPPQPSTQSNQRQSFKVARPVREPQVLTSNVIAKDTGLSVAPESTPEARLQKLTEPRAEERLMRDIPFVPPEPLERPTPQLRTYRNDALSDIQTRELSRSRIAAAERERRDTTGIPLFVAPTQTSPRTPLILAGIFLVLCIGGVGTYLFVHRVPSSTRPSTPVHTSSLFTTEQTGDIPLPQSRVALLEALNKARATPLVANEFAYLHLILSDAGATRDASTDEIMRVLDPKAPSTFMHTLTGSMFGSYGDSEAPFIVLKVSNFDIAFAGMLKWEEYMSIDLAPFFGDPVRRTYDDSALTSDHTRPAYFTDDTIQGTDVRILYNETGHERLIYAFINPETLVITTSHESLLALIARLR